MAYNESNGHMTNYVTLPPWKVELVIQIRSEPSISKTAGDIETPLERNTMGIECSRDWWRHMILKTTGDAI